MSAPLLGNVVTSGLDKREGWKWDCFKSYYVPCGATSGDGGGKKTTAEWAGKDTSWVFVVWLYLRAESNLVVMGICHESGGVWAHVVAEGW